MIGLPLLRRLLGDWCCGCGCEMGGDGCRDFCVILITTVGLRKGRGGCLCMCIHGTFDLGSQLLWVNVIDCNELSGNRSRVLRNLSQSRSMHVCLGTNDG
jgi:hypothetical protein